MLFFSNGRNMKTAFPPPRLDCFYFINSFIFIKYFEEMEHLVGKLKMPRLLQRHATPIVSQAWEVLECHILEGLGNSSSWWVGEGGWDPRADSLPWGLATWVTGFIYQDAGFRFFFNLYWNTVDSQCCVSFRHTAKWLYTLCIQKVIIQLYTHTHIFFLK